MQNDLWTRADSHRNYTSIGDVTHHVQNDLGISEAMLTGESIIKRKGDYAISDSEGPEEALKISPALFAGTFVQEGEGRMIVLAVGKNTYQGLMEEKMKEDEQEKSVLQSKLDDMTDLITKVGAGAGVLTILVLLLRLAIGFAQKQCCMEVWDHSIHCKCSFTFIPALFCWCGRPLSLTQQQARDGWWLGHLCHSTSGSRNGVSPII